MRRLALLLSLLALGALGLTACGGGDDDEVTAASETENTDDGNPYDYDELAADPADNQSCGNPGGRGLTVVEGDISCREVRGLMHRVGDNRLPYQWRCSGPEGATGGYEVCTNMPGTSSRIVIKVRFGRERSRRPTPETTTGSVMRSSSRRGATSGKRRSRRPAPSPIATWASPPASVQTANAWAAGR